MKLKFFLSKLSIINFYPVLLKLGLRHILLRFDLRGKMKIRELFDQCATKYDQDRPRLVPCFDEYLRHGHAYDTTPE